MKRRFSLTLVLCAICAMFTMNSCSYNSLVANEEKAESAWSEVQNQYQRRMDLVPNLVSTVKGYAAHEKSTLDAVISARSKATSINLSVDDLTEENLAKFQKAQDELGSCLGRLMAVAESYPNLKANENFLDLQAQLEGTENRIAVARRNFNEAAQNYNTLTRKFPAIITAKIFGFKKKAYFQAAAGAESAPTVDFSEPAKAQ